nr:FCD domain-containing protein [Rhizobium sp.]
LEGLTAELAAQRATETDKAILARIIDDMRRAHADGPPEAELAADVEFHNAVGEAAHNIILLHTMRACYRLLSEGILFNRQAVFSLPNARERLLEQHVAIQSAILAGDPAGAKRAAQAHIDFVMQAAADSARSDEWGRVSKLRLLRREGADPAPRNTRSTKTDKPS